MQLTRSPQGTNGGIGHDLDWFASCKDYFDYEALYATLITKHFTLYPQLGETPTLFGKDAVRWTRIVALT